jgi:hypothetical protein
MHPIVHRGAPSARALTFNARRGVSIQISDLTALREAGRYGGGTMPEKGRLLVDFVRTIPLTQALSVLVGSVDHIGKIYNFTTNCHRLGRHRRRSRCSSVVR